MVSLFKIPSIILGFVRFYNNGSSVFGPQNFTSLAHIKWDMGDGQDGVVDTHGIYGPLDWHCYSFNRHDSWTEMHDWGCYNWHMIRHVKMRDDPEAKDQKFF